MQKTLAIIDEDKKLVHQAQLSIERSTPLDDFYNYLSMNAGQQISMRPRNIVCANRDKSMVLLEMPPEWRVVKTATWFSGDDKKVLFPWTYFFIQFSGSSPVKYAIYFRNDPIEKCLDEMTDDDEQEKLYVPPLSNLYLGESGRVMCEICMGSTFDRYSVNGATLHQRTKSAAEAVFDSNWNADLAHVHYDRMPEVIREHAINNFGYVAGNDYSGEMFDAWADLSRDGRWSFEWTYATRVREIFKS